MMRAMSFINEETKEINCKIVYYGSPRSGKSTSLWQIFHNVSEGVKGELISLSSDNNHTLYFDFVPITLGKIGEHTIRLHLYTVPGDIAYDAIRKIISKGVDGVVFVVDSQLEMAEHNMQSLKELKTILKQENMDWSNMPKVFQYNKRDLDNAVSVEQLQELVNPDKKPYFETIATSGEGILDALESISKQALMDLQKHFSESK